MVDEVEVGIRTNTSRPPGAFYSSLRGSVRSCTKVELLVISWGAEDALIVTQFPPLSN